MRLVLFDIDGTLVNALGAGRAALETAMDSVYGRISPAGKFDFHGMTDPAILRELLRRAGWAEERVDRSMGAVWPAYYAELDRELAARNGRVHTYPGVTDLLDAITADRRFVTCLVTGNMEPGAWRKLAACGLSTLFRFGAFGSDSESRDDLPAIARRRAALLYGSEFDLREAVVVGDTPADVRCARVNGARVLSVATGRHTVEELWKHDPDHVVENLADVSSVMRMLVDE